MAEALTWPTTLPAPNQNGYGETPPNNVISWKPDYGLAMLRRRSTAGVRPLSLQYTLTQAEIATLDTFYVTTTLGGTARFNFTHPRTLSTVSARFLDGKAPDYSSLSHLGLVSVALEVLP